MRKRQCLSAVRKVNWFFLSVAILAMLSYVSIASAGLNAGAASGDPIPPAESVTKDLKDTGKNPSKEETMAFIQERCDNLKYYEDKVVDRVYLEGCNLMILQTSGKFGEKDTQKVQVTIPLKDMDPAIIRLGFDPGRVLFTGFINSGVQMNSKNEMPKVTIVKENYNSEGKYKKEESKAPSFTFHCKNETVAAKVARAAAHLTEICGGKEDLF